MLEFAEVEVGTGVVANALIKTALCTAGVFWAAVYVLGDNVMGAFGGTMGAVFCSAFMLGL